MTASKSAIAAFLFFMFVMAQTGHRTLNGPHPACNQRPVTRRVWRVAGSMWEVRCARSERLKDDQIVAVHHFGARHLLRVDFTGTKLTYSACEFRAVQVANPHHVARAECALAARDAGRQQALALFAQGVLRA